MALLEYDPSCNALYIRLKRGKVAESEPISDNVILDLNNKKEIVGIEVLGPAPIDISKFSLPVKVISKSRRSQSK
ncbi:MAG: hypothetical protein AOA65_2037 [Candidatus Bathyarchaeota archaeon BA1]|nr:MAG: hypothetical protein AOA65_2037 [Candidatus Bathyarchaeota archaeon BA1]